MATKTFENIHMTPVAVVDGFRTPFCKAGSDLKDIRPEIIGALVIKEMMQRMDTWGVKTSVIDYVVGSNVCTPIHAPTLARVAAVKASLPESIPAQMITQNCGSGIAAVDYGSNLIRLGRHDCVLVVGVELMSQIPLVYADTVKKEFFRLFEARTKIAKLKALSKLYPKLFKIWVKDYQPQSGLELGLTDPICDLIMPLTAENIARDPCFGITRQDQDAFAARSHQRASTAQTNGILGDEIVGLYIHKKNKHVWIDADNGIRSEGSSELLAKLKPRFDKRYGSITAGNSSQITDGAACILLMNADMAKSYGLPIMGYVGEYADVGFDPSRMGLAPAGAIAKLLYKTKHDIGSFSNVEINEAFAAQVIACLRTLDSDVLMKKWFGSYGFDKKIGEIDGNKFNPNGGAIALGHPIGVSGMRLVITALKNLNRQNGRRALVSACIGGGQANAMVLEGKLR